MTGQIVRRIRGKWHVRADFRRAGLGSGVLRVASMVAVACGMMLPMAGHAEGPAVSGPNGKLSIEGGSVSGDGTFLGLGSYTVPLSHDFGVQFDAAFGKMSDHVLGGGGAHLFMRDPSRYLLGVYGSYHTWNDIDIWRAAGEVELYHGPVSFSGLAGIQGVDQAATDSSHLFGQFDLSYYPTEDLKLAAGYSYENETSLGTVGVEYLMHKTGVAPVSLFAKGRFGASDYQSITGGLKVHFGADPSASLMARNRTADPENYTPIFPATNSGGGGGVCGDVRAEYPDGSCTCPEGTNPSETDHGTFYCKRPT